jgi:hypothetical protein
MSVMDQIVARIQGAEPGADRPGNSFFGNLSGPGFNDDDLGKGTVTLADYATRYTPGSTDFERIVTQWNANVAEIGTEKGSTGGALRPLKLLGDDVRLPVKAFAALGAPPDGTVVYCSDGKVTSGVDNTIANGGGGALAIRIAGAWKAIQ